MGRLTYESLHDLNVKYPHGSTVRCLEMLDNDPVPAGTLGTVIGIDRLGQIKVKWENGSGRPLCPSIDEFEKVPMISVIRKIPGADPFIDSIPNDLHTLQDIVGGYIEVVRIDDDVVIICDEEALYHNAEQNMKICGCMFCGPIIICGVDGEEFSDVPEEAKELFMNKKEDEE